MFTRDLPPPIDGKDDPIPDSETVKRWLTRTLRLASLLRRQLSVSQRRKELDSPAEAPHDAA